MEALGRLGLRDARSGAPDLPGSPVSDWDQEGWRERAECRHSDVRVFFTIGATGSAVSQIAAAKAICRRCPVREACLQFAFETKQEYGVWGGTDEDERRRLRRAWRSGRKVVTSSAGR